MLSGQHGFSIFSVSITQYFSWVDRMRKSENNCRIETLSIYGDARRWQILCITCILLTLSLSQQHVAYAGFTYTGTMTSERRNHTSTTLADGRVLMTGGTTSSTTTFLSSAEIYDPATGNITPTGSMSTGRAYHTATRLPDGNILIAGGLNSTGKLATAELFDPTAGSHGSFTSTGSMDIARAIHTATLLNDGSVLVAGGQSGTDKSTTLATAQIFNPETGTFSPTNGNLSIERRLHTATLLNDGRVLFTGGLTTSVATNTAELYTPTTGTFALAAATMSSPRNKHTAVLLDDGRVLIAGGYNASNILATAEIFDTGASDTFSTTASMISGRTDHTATRLLNGKVLITGGYLTFGGSIAATAEVFNPAGGGTFITAGTMYSARAFHSAAILNNGTVVISGGIGTYVAPFSAEIYDPAAIKVNPLVHTFLDAYILNESIPQSFTITNSGLDTLTLNSIEFSGTDGSMFTLDTDSCGPFPFILPANGGNCSINVNFVPISRGYKSASLDIYSNDPEKPVLSAALSGTGVAVTFTIFFDGTGAGSTTSVQNGLNCLSGSGALCQAQVVPGTEISVFAAGDKHSLFEKWSDDCIVSENNGCTIMVNNDISVTATFDYIEPAMIESFDKLHRTYYPTLLDAYSGAIAGAGNVIQARTFTFTGPLVFDQNIGVTLKGGYDLNYSSNQDYSVLNGGLIIRNDTVIVEKVVVRGGL